MPTASRPRLRIHVARAVLAAAIAVGALPLLPAAAQEEPPPCTVHWTGGAGTDRWEDHGNWDTGLPDAGDVVCVDGAVGGEIALGADLTVEVAALRSTARLHVAAGSVQIAGASDAAGLRVTGGVVGIGSHLRVDELTQTGGEITGPGDLRVIDQFLWAGGTQSGSGRTHTGIAAADGVLSVSGAADHRIEGRTIEAPTGATFTDAGPVVIDGGALVLDGESVVASGDLDVTGAGTVFLGGRLDVGAANVEIAAELVTLPTAEVHVAAAGELGLSGEGSHAATYVLDDGALVTIRDGEHSITPDGEVTGGWIGVVGADAVLHLFGAVATDTFSLYDGLVTVGARVDLGDLEIRGGTLRIADGTRVEAALVEHSAGAVDGEGTVLVEGEYRWSGGDMLGGGFTGVGTLVVDGDADRAVHERVLDARRAAWQTAAPVTIDQDGALSVGLDFVVDGVHATILGDGLITVADLRVTQLAQFDVHPRMETPPDGTIDVADGSTLALLGGGSHSGTLTVVGSVDLGGDHAFETTGQLAVADGATRVLSGATVAAHADLSLGHLENAGGIRVAADLQAASVLNRGTISVDDGASLRASGDGGVVNDGGQLVLLGPDAVVGVEEGEIGNLADATISGQGRLDGALVNGGTVELDGRLAVTGPFTQHGGGTLAVTIDSTAHGTLAGAAAVALDGTLALDLRAAPPTDRVTVVEGSSLAGEFVTVTGLDDCTDVRYTATAAVVDVSSCIVVAAGVAHEDDELIDFAIELPEPLDEPLVITGTPEDGSATAGTDFAEGSVAALVEPGATTAVLSIPLVDDDEGEPEESFTLHLDAEGAPLASFTVSGTILDDDIDLSYELERLPFEPAPFVEDSITDVGGGLAVGRSDGPIDTIGFVYRYATNQVATARDMRPAAVNDTGVIVGDCDDIGLCVREAGATAPMLGAGDVVAINNDGVVVGSSGGTTPHAARWPSTTSAPELLPDLGAARSFATDVNDHGVVVGYSVDDATTARPWYWNAEDGTVEIEVPPGYPTRVEAHAVNDHGVVVGLAQDTDSVRAWSWSEDGGFVDLGPGMAQAVDDDGIVYGAGMLGAALWRNGEQILLAELLDGDLAPGTFLHNAFRVDASGTLAVTVLGGGSTVYALLIPDGAGCDVCVEVSVEETQFPAPDAWATGDGVVTEGSPARVAAQVRNATAQTQTVDVQVELDGEPLGEPQTLTLAPNATALAHAELDTDGLAWDGELPVANRLVAATVVVDGEERDDDDLSLVVDPRPMVLVHGPHGSASDWGPLTARINDVNDRWGAYTVAGLDTDGGTTIATNARTLAGFVEDLQATTNAWSIDVVAHSGGGLVARYYLDRLMPPAAAGGAPVVRNLAMLGTPNAGTPCAALVTDPAYAELRPDLVARFNERIAVPPGVRVSAAAGDYTDDTCGSGEPGDLFVPVQSATAGASHAAFFDVRHHAFPASAAVFDEFLLPLLRSGDETGSAGLTDTASSPSAAAVTAEGSPQLLSLDDVTVAAGRTREVPVPLVPADLASIGAVAVVPGSVELALVRNGTVAATSGTDDDAGAAFRTVTASSPGPGTWSVRLVNNGTTAVSTPVAVFVTGAATRLEVVAEQVGETDRLSVRAELTGPLPAELPDRIVADVLGGAEEGPLAVELHDDGAHDDGAAGDGVYAGEERGFGLAAYTVFVDVEASGFYRATTAAAAFAFGPDGTGNDAPTAFAAAVAVPGGATTAIVLEGTDPEGSVLTYEVVDLPAHGTLGGGGHALTYTPVAGFAGEDTFTFRVHDGELHSAPATVTIDVGGVATAVEYLGPFPPSGTQGSTFEVSSEVVDGHGLRIDAPLAVEFAFEDQTVTTTTINGVALASIVLDVSAGTYPLVITVPGDDGHAGSTTTQQITVVTGAAPRPRFTDTPVTGEAGYTVELRALADDPDDDAVRFEFDMDDDGVVDAVAERPDGDRDRGMAVHVVYPAAFDGLARVRVTDLAGNTAEATTPVRIAPHRPLGDLQVVESDTGRAPAVDVDASGNVVLYAFQDDAVDGEPQPLRVLDRAAGTSEVVSVLPDGTVEGHPLPTAVISSNGRFVAFSAFVTLGRGLTAQAFVYDRATDTSRLVSRNDSGAIADHHATAVDVSDDGRWVLLRSSAPNLGGGPLPNCGTAGQSVDPCPQLFLRDDVDGRLVHVSADADGAAVRVGSVDESMSSDGRYVVYPSQGRVVLWDRTTETGATVAIGSGDIGATEPSISDDGRHVLFLSDADGLVAGDDNGTYDVFRFDRQTGTTALVSEALDGTSAAGLSQRPRMTGDASMVVFLSRAPDLVAGDENSVTDVFVRDIAAGTTRRISVEPRDGLEADARSTDAFITCAGDEVLFDSEATNLVPGDVNARVDLFAFATGVTDRCGDEPAPDPNRPPAAEDARATTVAGEPVVITLHAADPDGDELAYAIATAPVHGVVTGDAPVVTYSPADGFTGTDTFTFTATDGAATSAPATVTVTVVPPDTGGGDDPGDGDGDGDGPGNGGGGGGGEDACAARPTARFVDVGPADVHRQPIECLAALGIASGGPGGRPRSQFGPTLDVTRAQIASFVGRTLAVAGVDLPTDAPDAFIDDDGDPHEPMIDAVAALGILDGRSTDVFDPSAPVTRAQMASILARAHGVLTGDAPGHAPDAFVDDDGILHERNINSAAAAGLVRGVLPPGTFDPTGDVSRAQMASFLLRLLSAA